MLIYEGCMVNSVLLTPKLQIKVKDFASQVSSYVSRQTISEDRPKSSLTGQLSLLPLLPYAVQRCVPLQASVSSCR
jgi:hypothetical protein